MIHPRSGKLGFPIAKQNCPSQVCTQACLIPGALEWQFQVESWESGSITVLERTFLENVVPLLGSCFLVSQTVLQGDRACPLPHHISLCISFYFSVPVGYMHLSVPEGRLWLQSRALGGFPPSYPTLLLQGRVFLRRSSLLILPVEVPCWGYSGWICLSPLHNTGVMGTHSHAWPFTSVQGNQTQDFTLSEQELYPLSNLTSPWISSIHPLFTSLAQKKKKKEIFVLLTCLCVFAHAFKYLQEPEESIGPPRVGVTDAVSCQMWVL